jgi:hypothetical protein
MDMDTNTIQTIAETTAELTARKVVDELKSGFLLPIHDRVNSHEQTLHGDNGHGLVKRIERMQAVCTERRENCQTAMNLIRKAADDKAEDISANVQEKLDKFSNTLDEKVKAVADAAAAPAATVNRWKIALASVGSFIVGMGTLVGILKAVHLLK